MNIFKLAIVFCFILFATSILSTTPGVSQNSTAAENTTLVSLEGRGGGGDKGSGSGGKGCDGKSGGGADKGGKKKKT